MLTRDFESSDIAMADKVAGVPNGYSASIGIDEKTEPSPFGSLIKLAYRLRSTYDRLIETFTSSNCNDIEIDLAGDRGKPVEIFGNSLDAEDSCSSSCGPVRSSEQSSLNDKAADGKHTSQAAKHRESYKPGSDAKENEEHEFHDPLGLRGQRGRKYKCRWSTFTPSNRPVYGKVASGRHACRFCAYRTDNLTHVRRHEIRVHDCTTPYVCRVCRAEFPSVDGMRAHFSSGVHPGYDHRGIRKTDREPEEGFQMGQDVYFDHRKNNGTDGRSKIVEADKMIRSLKRPREKDVDDPYSSNGLMFKRSVLDESYGYGEKRSYSESSSQVDESMRHFEHWVDNGIVKIKRKHLAKLGYSETSQGGGIESEQSRRRQEEIIRGWIREQKQQEKTKQKSVPRGKLPTTYQAQSYAQQAANRSFQSNHDARPSEPARVRDAKASRFSPRTGDPYPVGMFSNSSTGGTIIDAKAMEEASSLSWTKYCSIIGDESSLPDSRFFVCRECPFDADEIWSMKRHSLSHHAGVEWHRCRVCRYVSAQREKVVTHMHTYHGEIYCVEDCQFATMDVDGFNRHLKECPVVSGISGHNIGDTGVGGYVMDPAPQGHVTSSSAVGNTISSTDGNAVSSTAVITASSAYGNSAAISCSGENINANVTVSNASATLESAPQRCEAPGCRFVALTRRTLDTHLENYHNALFLSTAEGGTFFTGQEKDTGFRRRGDALRSSLFLCPFCPSCRTFKYRKSFEKHLAGHGLDFDYSPECAVRFIV